MQKFIPTKSQELTIKAICNNLRFGIFLPMSAGKTAATLTAISELLNAVEVKKVLIIAPIHVAGTVWAEEAKKWDHLRHLTFSKILGSPKKRLAALDADAQIYLINRESIVWLCALYKNKLPFDTIIVDELSTFKNHTSSRFRALSKAAPNVKRFYGLTGTPAARAIDNLWSQLKLIDNGERLGRTITAFRSAWCVEGYKINTVVSTYEVPKHKHSSLLGKINDIVLSIGSEDGLNLPDIQYIIAWVNLYSSLQIYDNLQKNKIVEVEGKTIIALNSAERNIKLLQGANGFFYSENKEVVAIHDHKLKKLRELIDGLNGSPVLIAYNYIADLDRIKDILQDYNPRSIDTDQDINDWNCGRIKVLIAHPASVGHGLNLQFGGNTIIWFGLTFDLELYEQFNKRIHRRGQSNTVQIYQILAEDTIDLKVYERLKSKAALQNKVLNELKAK